jgi:hypothetical protein
MNSFQSYPTHLNIFPILKFLADFPSKLFPLIRVRIFGSNDLCIDLLTAMPVSQFYTALNVVKLNLQ